MLNERFTRETRDYSWSERPGSLVIVWLYIHISATALPFPVSFFGAVHIYLMRGKEEEDISFRLIPITCGRRLIIPSPTFCFLPGVLNCGFWKGRESICFDGNFSPSPSRMVCSNQRDSNLGRRYHCVGLFFLSVHKANPGYFREWVHVRITNERVQRQVICDGETTLDPVLD